MKITKQMTQSTILAALDTPLTRLRADSNLAHDQGYHDYSRVLADLAFHIEKARDEAILELEDM